MDIKTALEGREVCDKLHSDLSKLRYNPDLHKMLKNISNMVTEISKIEVGCRRTMSLVALETPLKKLNEAISRVSEKMNISEDTIREIIAYEYRNLFSK